MYETPEAVTIILVGSLTRCPCSQLITWACEDAALWHASWRRNCRSISHRGHRLLRRRSHERGKAGRRIVAGVLDGALKAIHDRVSIEGEAEGALAWKACGRWEFVPCELVHNVTFDAPWSKGTKPVVISFHREATKTSFSCDPLVLVQIKRTRRFRDTVPKLCTTRKRRQWHRPCRCRTRSSWTLAASTIQHPRQAHIHPGAGATVPTLAARGLQEGRRFDIGASTTGPPPPLERLNCHPRRASTIRSSTRRLLTSGERERTESPVVCSVYSGAMSFPSGLRHQPPSPRRGHRPQGGPPRLRPVVMFKSNEELPLIPKITLNQQRMKK